MRPSWTDERFNQTVGSLLRIGVMAAALVVLAGGVFYLIRFGGDPPQYRVFQRELEELRSISGIIAGIFSHPGRGLIQLGVLLLIATPVARVAFSFFAFAMQRDRTYLWVTFLVLMVLIYSLVRGSL